VKCQLCNKVVPYTFREGIWDVCRTCRDEGALLPLERRAVPRRKRLWTRRKRKSRAARTAAQVKRDRMYVRGEISCAGALLGRKRTKKRGDGQ
jgi:hypothetical protein